LKWRSPSEVEARYILLGIFIGWVTMLLVWGNTTQGKPPDSDPDKLLARSMAIAARCIVETTACLDRLEASRKVECRQ